MMHRNTPNQESGISPAEMLYGVKLHDHLPNKFRSVRKEWKDIQKAMEIKNATRDLKMKESSLSRRTLQPLQDGDKVSIQNQTGNHPKKWNNTGQVIAVLPNRQYKVMVDGSRRVTLRNRKFLRRIRSDSWAQPEIVKQVVIPMVPNPVVEPRRSPPVAASPKETSQTETPRHVLPQDPSQPTTPTFQRLPASAIPPEGASQPEIPCRTPESAAPTAAPRSVANLPDLETTSPGQQNPELQPAVEGTPQGSGEGRRYPTRKRKTTRRLITEM